MPRRSQLKAVENQPDAIRARILVVDDDERNLLALSEVLDGVADIVTASSGREALRQRRELGEIRRRLLRRFSGRIGRKPKGPVRARAVLPVDRAIPALHGLRGIHIESGQA